MTPEEASRRLAVAEDELAVADALGLGREVSAYTIAVDVLREIAGADAR